MENASKHTFDVPSGTVHRTIGLLAGALHRLRVPIEDPAVERIGVMVNRAMNTHQRCFHTAEHIFDLSDPTDAHATLAALFHDLVYFQVDDGFLPEIEELLRPYLFISDDGVAPSVDVPADDRSFHRCLAVFGFAPGRPLSPFGGLNEFLSALVMNLLLEEFVAEEDLFVATACIEQTIPFRRRDEAGRTPPEVLAVRLGDINRDLGLDLSAARLEEVVVTAVCFANRDVRNFAEEDVGRFLDNTWKLLPETNPDLRLGGVYSIRSYGLALLKMEGFLQSLDAETIFHRYAESPALEDYREVATLAARNLATGRRYLGIKLLSAGVLAALAELTGGDAPVAYFMGDLRPRDETGKLAAYLPARPSVCRRDDDEDDTLYRLFAHGRASESPFDLQNSPLSLFVYRCLGDGELDAGIVATKEFFLAKRSPRALLDDLPSEAVGAIARAAARMAFTRSSALLALAEDIER
ncbi:MAG: hypothetical protein MI724_17165, partial [Spirochaetales bacterium]|nr:hypothetical protein [Spirochaetales bacterium]